MNIKKINSLPPVSEMLKDFDLTARKQLGQNFLFDLNLTQKIARSVPNIENIPIVEIGPGPGGLTRALLMAGALRIIAIEKDKKFEPILSKVAGVSDGHLTVIYGDALRTDLKALGITEYAICANLPYNVGTQLLIDWLHRVASGENIQSMTLMFQREVADRIVADVGSSAYGRLSVLTALIADAKILFNVPNTAFVPRPKVQSAVVQIIPNADKIKEIFDLDKIEKITFKLFNQKRKMIRGIIPNTDWSAFNLFGTERPGELSPRQFLELSKKLVL